MIVRILGEGQLELADSALDELNEMDARLAAAIDATDEAQFRTELAGLLDRVRAVGVPLPDDSLEESDLVLPPEGATMAQVAQLLGQDGLIPG